MKLMLYKNSYQDHSSTITIEFQNVTFSDDFLNKDFNQAQFMKHFQLNFQRLIVLTNICIKFVKQFHY